MQGHVLRRWPRFAIRPTLRAGHRRLRRRPLSPNRTAPLSRWRRPGCRATSGSAADVDSACSLAAGLQARGVRTRLRVPPPTTLPGCATYGHRAPLGRSCAQTRAPQHADRQGSGPCLRCGGRSDHADASRATPSATRERSFCKARCWATRTEPAVMPRAPATSSADMPTAIRRVSNS